MTSFDSYMVPAMQLDFNVDAKIPWRLEYSEDRENWVEGGCAQKSPTGGLMSTMATPLRGPEG